MDSMRWNSRHHTKDLLLLLISTGCIHRSSEETVLAPIVAHFTQHPVSQSKQREYVIFADELTARVFESLRRDPRYRIVPTGKAFVCPPTESPCPPPYELSARVDTIMGDTAIASLVRTEASRSGSHATQYGEQILLLRRNGRWEVEKSLGYSAVIPM
jgi:hypothetical protein